MAEQTVSDYEPGVLRVFQSKDETKSFYNKIAHVYDLLAEHSEQPMRENGLEMLAVKPGETVLDLCTGTGELALTFASQGATVIGADLARGMLKVASTKGKALDSTWFQMEATNLAFADKAFDVSVLSLALHHMPENVQVNVLGELRRVTRRQVVIIEPDVPVKPNWVPIYAFVASIIDESEYMHEWVIQDLPRTCRTAELQVEGVHESTFGLHRILLCKP